MGILDGVKITKLEKENTVLKDEILKLQEENESLKNQIEKCSELKLEESIKEFQELIYEVELQKKEYTQIIRDITKIKAEFKADIDKIKNDIKEV